MIDFNKSLYLNLYKPTYVDSVEADNIAGPDAQGFHVIKSKKSGFFLLASPDGRIFDLLGERKTIKLSNRKAKC